MLIDHYHHSLSLDAKVMVKKKKKKKYSLIIGGHAVTQQVTIPKYEGTYNSKARQWFFFFFLLIEIY